jgi:hypothetical protein
MTSKRAALMTIIGKLGKIIPLLASDKAGEVVAAAGKAHRLLASVKIDWHDLVKILSEEPDTKHSGPLSGKEPDILFRLALAGASLFHTTERVTYADITVGGHRETWPIKGTEFSDWLLRRFFVEKGKIPTDAALKTAIRSLQAHSFFGGNEQHEIYQRVAESDGRIYLDLCDAEWQAIEIDANGWRIIDSPPVRFRRTTKMQPLPLPQRGGKIDQLRPLVNLNDDDFILFISVVLDGLRTGRPHAILYLAGETGSAKSTLSDIIGRLIDPSSIPPRNLPGVRDLFVAAHNKHLLIFDNISMITAAVSDALCQIASRAGYSKRKNYTDSGEFSVSGNRPLILTGVTNCIDRPDLADRTIVLNLSPIGGERRRSDDEFWTAFKTLHPKIFGAILDAVSHGLGELPRVKLARMSRIADFQLWANACETSFTQRGSFQRAFERNASETVEGLIDNDHVCKAVGSLMITRHHWQGTAAELLRQLTDHDGTEAQVSKLPKWPRDPSIFARHLRRTAAVLRKAGIEVVFGKTPDRSRTRIVTLRKGETNDRPQETPRRSDTDADSPDGTDAKRAPGKIVRFQKK